MQNQQRFYKDYQGSVVAIADEYGKIVESYRYYAWGNMILGYQSNSIKFNLSPSDKNAQTNTASGSKSWITNYRLYTAREWDEEIEMYYYRARHYDARMGRFIQRDPLGYNAGDLGLYRYVGNNPLNFTDPWGLEKTSCPVNKFEFLATGHPLYDKNASTSAGKQINNLIVQMYADTSAALNSSKSAWSQGWDVVDVKDQTEAQINEICKATKSNHPYCNTLEYRESMTQLGNVLAVAEIAPAFVEGGINLATKVPSLIKGAKGIITEAPKVLDDFGRWLLKPKQGAIRRGGFGDDAAQTSQTIFGSTTKSLQKLLSQITKRGWTESSVLETIQNPHTIRSAINKATGNAATVYYKADGAYVVVDDITKEIVQVSDAISPSTWIPDSSIVNPFISK